VTAIGINVSDVNDLIETAIGGKIASNFFEDENATLPLFAYLPLV